MNNLSKSIITAATLAAAHLHAETFPVMQDTYGHPLKGTIAKVSGKAVSLPVSKNSTAFVKFNFGSAGYSADQIAAARIILYIPQVTTPGSFNLDLLTSGFQETFTSPTTPNPTQSSTPLTTIPLTTASKKTFLVINATALVQFWASNPTLEFGVSITSDGTAAFTIGSKEGAATGYPAILEVDIKSSSFTGANGSFSDSLRVDSSESNNGTLNNGALIFGEFGSGEGISSKRTSGGGNQYGLDFTAGFERRMSITNGGNVGIGTTTPGEMLDVNGNIRATNNITVQGTTGTGNASLRRDVNPGKSRVRVFSQYGSSN